jgi:hypothetical protein
LLLPLLLLLLLPSPLLLLLPSILLLILGLRRHEKKRDKERCWEKEYLAVLLPSWSLAVIALLLRLPSVHG